VSDRLRQRAAKLLLEIKCKGRNPRVSKGATDGSDFQQNLKSKMSKRLRSKCSLFFIFVIDFSVIIGFKFT